MNYYYIGQCQLKVTDSFAIHFAIEIHKDLYTDETMISDGELSTITRWVTVEENLAVCIEDGEDEGKVGCD